MAPDGRCKAFDARANGYVRGEGGGVIVLGEVVRFHVREDLFDNFRIDPAGLDAIGRMAGNTWVRTRDRVELIRPK